MDWKAYLWVSLGVVAIVVATYFLSSHFQRKADLAEFANTPADTVYYTIPDTVWHPVVRVKYLTQTVHDTIWATIPSKPDTDTLLYVIAADTANERFSMHLAYFQPAPLHPEGFFGDIRVDIRDSVRTVEITRTVIEYKTDFPLWQTIGIGSLTFGLGVWLGSR